MASASVRARLSIPPWSALQELTIHESLKNRFVNPFAIANQQSAKVVLGRELIKPVAWRTEIDVRLAPKATRLLRGSEMTQWL
jgi:hypothetical protein